MLTRLIRDDAKVELLSRLDWGVPHQISERRWLLDH